MPFRKRKPSTVDSALYDCAEMENFDRAGEYRRLSDLYREISDHELLDLARRPSELTEIAQQAVRSEISRRGLKPEPVESHQLSEAVPPPDAQDPNDPNFDQDRQLVSIRTVWSAADALQLQQLLAGAGIPSYIGPERATSPDAVTSNFADGVDILVMSIGVPWARLAMKNYTPANDPADEFEEIVDEASVRCPKCHSTEVVLEETEPVREGTSPEHFKWTCDACGSHWEDDGVEDSR
jgi:DNA-directed RNA polymerase subunit M/transcription elongation factor TFIIS